MLIILLRLKTLRQSFNLLNYPEQGSLTRDKLNKKMMNISSSAVIHY